MIEFTIKTLDSSDHFFSVEDEITVEQLKEKVTEQMGVPSHMQRLIFCGRVLQDDKKLADYGVHGKVVHMVQRPPPGFENRRSTQREQGNTSGHSHGSHTSGTNNTASSNSGNQNNTSESQIRNLIAMATSEVSDQPVPTPTTSRMQCLKRIIKDIKSTVNSVMRTDGESLLAGHYSRNSDGDVDTEDEAPDDSLQGIRRNGPIDAETTPSEFAEMIAELRLLESTFHRYRDAYIDILRDCDDESVHLTDADLRRRQRSAEVSAELYHSFAHAYHVVSDITLHMDDENTHLSSNALTRHMMPLQLPMNVIESLNRTANPNGNNMPGETPGTGNQAQAERGDEDLHPPELENIVRGLNEIARIGNLEVVVSLEEVTQAGLLGHLRRQSANNVPVQNIATQIIESNGGTVQPLFGSQVFLAQMPFGAPPSAEMLQNIVSSVVRQSIVPGMEGVLHAQIISGLPNQGGNRAQPNQRDNAAPNTVPNTNGATAANRQNERPAQNTAQSGSQSQTPNQSQERKPQQSGNNSERNTTDPPRSNAERIRMERNRQQTQLRSVENHIYDILLDCDSRHARRMLVRRRDESLRVIRNAMGIRVPNPQTKINSIFEKLDRTCIGAEYLIIAGIILMDESRNLPRTRCLTSEGLITLRQRLESYVFDLMQRNCSMGSEPELTDIIFDQHSDFINRLLSLVPLHQHINVMVSLKAAFCQCLDELTMILDTQNNDVFLRCFRIFANHIFTEMCGVIAACSPDGVEAVRVLYEAFLEQVLDNLQGSLHNTISNLAMDNLNIVINKILSKKTDTEQYICTIDGASTSMGRGSGSFTEYSSRRHDVMNITPPMTPLASTSEQPLELAQKLLAEVLRPTVLSQRAMEMTQPPMETAQQPSESTQRPMESQQPMELTQQPMEVTQPMETSPTLDSSKSKAVVEPSLQAMETSQEIDTLDVQPTSSKHSDVTDQAVSSGDRPSQRANRRPRSPSTSSDSQDTILRLVVPPEDIRRHWGEDWVPTFTRDLREQSDDVEPYSDAYLSGMPPSKRRCIRQSRPRSTLTDFLTDSVREAGRVAEVNPSHSLRVTFREHLRSITETRTLASPDYDPHRYIATCRFVNRQTFREVPRNPSPDKQTE